MQIPLQITTRNISLSNVAEDNIRDRASKLERFSERIIGCRVMVEAQHKHHHKGIIYKLRLDITLPGGEIVVNRKGDEDIYVAIRDSFDAARRQIEDYERKQRGDVKRHEPQPHGKVIKLFPEDGYGFLVGAENMEIYFHRNSVLNDAFDRIKIGTEIRYKEEMGDNGPQASTVEVVE